VELPPEVLEYSTPDLMATFWETVVKPTWALIHGVISDLFGATLGLPLLFGVTAVYVGWYHSRHAEDAQGRQDGLVVVGIGTLVLFYVFQELVRRALLLVETP
jgi:hypothetical protein